MISSVKVAVSDYSFVELAKVVQAIEVRADLKQIPEAAVSSFYFGKIGIDNLIRAKYKTINNLTDNKVKIKRYICGLPEPRDRRLVLMAASYIKTVNDQIGTVKSQIVRGVKLERLQQQELCGVPLDKEITDAEIPF